MSQSIINSFTLTIIKVQEKIKIFQNIFDKKISFTLAQCSIVQASKRKYKKPFKSSQTHRDFRSKRTKIPTLIFEAKYYLIGPKIILMALHSIFL